MPEIVGLHAEQSEFELKKNLYNKVQKIMAEAKIEKYSQEKEKVAEEKIGFFGKLMGKQKLQNEKINQLDLKMKLAKVKKPEEKEKYSVRDMLSDLYVCAKTELNGQFTPEMEELYDEMKECFRMKRR